MSLQKEPAVPNDPPDFDRGCWIRAITNPDKEKDILQKREGKTKDQLSGHDNQDASDYTPYSSCTFIIKGFSIRLFMDSNNSNDFGVFIRRFSSPIDWWYNGRKEIVSDSIKVIPGKPFNNGAPIDRQKWNASADEIEGGVRELRSFFARDSYYREHPDQPIALSWNEGKFRYQKSDITGIFVNPRSKQSVTAAFQFMNDVGIAVPFYSYNSDHGQCEYHSHLKLKVKYGLEPQHQSSSSSVYASSTTTQNPEKAAAIKTLENVAGSYTP